MRLPFSTLEIFNAIVQAGSMRGAADRLGVQPSTVSHQLKSLEEQMGKALFVRTTRSIQLTEAGRALLTGVGPAFEQLEDAYETARNTGHSERGKLRLAMPEFAYHMVLAPKLENFSATYPEIEIELSLTDALTDLLGDGFHAGFRLGDRIAQDMIAVRLTAPLPLCIVGSPTYFATHGRPKSPEDLLDHNCIRYRFQSSGHLAEWGFRSKDGDYAVEVTGQFIANSLPSSVDLATRGLGLAYTFSDYCASEIAAGKLESILDKSLPPTAGIYIYYPNEYRSMVPLRRLLEYLKA